MTKPVYVLTIPRPMSEKEVEHAQRTFESTLDGKLVIVSEGASLQRLNEDGWGARRGGFVRAGAMPDPRLELL